ncbi:hypothetical protein [Desulfobulbus alkaliphilus]|uniref:hypothetical protein n=1 Tax=Desulfobulbus alkaliphilus TaxID=869814 RepID=UPI001963A49C|nr:hypothetical protein [Desulfobulbus alkaliphilus]MBM9536800.1 hypothetical protein [Desulfobulbus alkaliphilus]
MACSFNQVLKNFKKKYCRCTLDPENSISSLFERRINISGWTTAIKSILFNGLPGQTIGHAAHARIFFTLNP